MSDEQKQRRSHPRVTHKIERWFGTRWRVDVMLDGYQVRKAYFDDYAAALAGAMSMEDEVIEEAGLHERR